MHSMLLSALLCATAAANPVYYVAATDGSDTNPGTIDKPLATLHAARDLLRSTRKNTTSPHATIILRGGVHDLTAGSLALDGRDSNTTWAAYKGERVLLSAGFHVGSDEWFPVTDPAILALLPKATRKSVRQANFSGFTSDFGHISGAKAGQIPFGVCNNADNKELFFRNSAAPMEPASPGWLARYPNILPNGTWNWSLVEKPFGAMNISTSVDPKRVGMWAYERDLWLGGYFEWDWAFFWARVHGITKDNRTLVLDPSTPTGHTPREKNRWLIQNALCELDAVGEYYLDREKGIAYFLPPQDGSDEVVLSNGVGIINATNLSNVSFIGLSFEFARGTAITCAGKCVDFVVADSTVANVGEGAISITDALRSGVKNSRVSNAGCVSVDVAGGDAMTLTAGQNFVRSSRVSNCSRWHRTFMPCVRFSGVGNVYESNLLEDGPMNAFVGGCVKCIFRNNTVRNFVHETADSGAWYDGRTFIHPGNLIVNNTFESIRHKGLRDNKGGTNPAIYFDDMLSSNSVINNTFIDCQMGVLIGGGRSHRVVGNTFEKQRSGDVSVWMDARGLNTPGDDKFCKLNGTFEQQARGVHFQSPPWSTEFPKIAKAFGDSPCKPKDNEIMGNSCSGGGVFFQTSPDEGKPFDIATGWGSRLANNSVSGGCANFTA